jgi:hypothetical protein
VDSKPICSAPGGRSNLLFPHSREYSLQTCNESNQTTPAATHDHRMHDHLTSCPVLQSIFLHGLLAALVCLAILAKHGLRKDRLLTADVDVHEVMDRDGQAVHAPQGTSTLSHHPIYLILSCLARSRPVGALLIIALAQIDGPSRVSRQHQ